MGQHRTREQKEAAQQKRMRLTQSSDGVGISYSAPNAVVMKTVKAASVTSTADASSIFLKKDLRHTLIATIIVVALLVLAIVLVR